MSLSVPPAVMGPVAAELPADELQRLAALRDYRILDTAAEKIFDDITEMAALICGTPIALVSLVDEHRQWFKSRVGLQAQETPREMAFCAHAILEPDRPFVVSDAEADPRFAGNPLVTGDPGIRFYAGAPIVTEDGHALGTVCTIDRVPRTLAAEQIRALTALSRQAARLLEWRRLSETERQRAEHEVAASRERLAQATAMAAHGLALQAYVDRDYIYRYVNKQYEHYWSVDAEQIVGHAVPALLGEELFASLVKPNLDRAFQGETVRFSTTFAYPHLGMRTMNVHYLPVYDADGGVCAAVVRAEDVNELVRAKQRLESVNEQLRQKNSLQERFIHMMSHDIREPVNTICNFGGLLEEDCADRLGDDGRRYLGFIQKGGERMRDLLDGLLTYVRMEGQEQGLQLVVDVPLDLLFAEVTHDLAAAVQRHDARLTPAPLPTVRGDPLLLRVLFQNLLANALKFHHPGIRPEVTWGGTHVQGGHEVWVQDQGIGIDPAQAGKLFGSFSRLVTRRQFEGTGLGLATCKRIVELHGGRIGLSSTPGEGSRFTVWLPAFPAVMEAVT